MKTLVIVDDDRIVCSTLAEVMTRILPRGTWEVVEIPSYEGADIALARIPRIDAAMITFSELGGSQSDGLPLIKQVRDQFPLARIIVVHQFEDQCVQKSAVAGADALIYKGDLRMDNLTTAFRSLKLTP